MAAAPSLLSSSSLPQQPSLLLTPQFSAHHAMSQHIPNFNRNRGRSRGNWRPHSDSFTPQNRGHSAADWRPNHWQQTRHNSNAG
jgi:hypothetical protein